MKFNATPEDFLKGRIVTPGFHPAVITTYEEKLSKAVDKDGQPREQSMYASVQFKIVSGEFAGTTIYQNFSEKAASFIAPFLVALGYTVDTKKGMNVDLSAEKLVGKNIDIHVVKGSYNGKPKNEIDGYKPFSGKPTGAPVQAGV